MNKDNQFVNDDNNSIIWEKYPSRFVQVYKDEENRYHYVRMTREIDSWNIFHKLPRFQIYPHSPTSVEIQKEETKYMYFTGVDEKDPKIIKYSLVDCDNQNYLGTEERTKFNEWKEFLVKDIYVNSTEDKYYDGIEEKTIPYNEKQTLTLKKIYIQKLLNWYMLKIGHDVLNKNFIIGNIDNTSKWLYSNMILKYRDPEEYSKRYPPYETLDNSQFQFTIRDVRMNEDNQFVNHDTGGEIVWEKYPRVFVDVYLDNGTYHYVRKRNERDLDKPPGQLPRLYIMSKSIIEIGLKTYVDGDYYHTYEGQYMYFTGVDEKDKKRIKYRYYYVIHKLKVKPDEVDKFLAWKKTLLGDQTPVDPNKEGLGPQNYYDLLRPEKKKLLDCYTLKVGHYDDQLSQQDDDVIKTYRTPKNIYYSQFVKPGELIDPRTV